jgi:hypothetical protein
MARRNATATFLDRSDTLSLVAALTARLRFAYHRMKRLTRKPLSTLALNALAKPTGPSQEQYGRFDEASEWRKDTKAQDG